MGYRQREFPDVSLALPGAGGAAFSGKPQRHLPSTARPLLIMPSAALTRNDQFSGSRSYRAASCDCLAASAAGLVLLRLRPHALK